MPPVFIFKVDVDTDRGTQIGVPQLLQLFKKHQVPASFFFSLGPDNTGKQIRRLFQPGFFKKVTRTNVLKLYGLKTLLYGTLLQAPQIAKGHGPLLQRVKAEGFEVGLHCYDHFEWQDYLHDMTEQEVVEEYQKGITLFKSVFGTLPVGTAAPGWQTNAYSLQVYDDLDLLYSSDTRGVMPFFPCIEGQSFRTLQLPTTLPTLDELLGQPGYPEPTLTDHYLELLQDEYPNIHTIHAEIEGMGKSTLLEELILKLKAKGVEFLTMEAYARRCLQHSEDIPFCQLVQKPFEGRAGLLACQGSIC